MTISAMPMWLYQGSPFRRTLTYYNCRLSRVLSMAGFLFSGMLVCFGLIGGMKEQSRGVAPSSVLAGLMLGVASLIGLISTYKYMRELWLVISVLIFQTAALVGCIGCVAICIIGFHRERPKSKLIHSTLMMRSTVEGCQLMLAVVSGTICTIFIVTTCRAIFHEHCNSRGHSNTGRGAGVNNVSFTPGGPVQVVVRSRRPSNDSSASSSSPPRRPSVDSLRRVSIDSSRYVDTGSRSSDPGTTAHLDLSPNDILPSTSADVEERETTRTLSSTNENHVTVVNKLPVVDV